MNVTLRAWRQPSSQAKGQMFTYGVADISSDMSFLEVLDVLNERLTLADEDPSAFDHDCREGFCGTCGVVINGVAHGSEAATTTCQLPHGQPERNSRALSVISEHDAEGFGACTQIGERTAVCPKGIQLDVVSRVDLDALSRAAAWGPLMRSPGGRHADRQG